VIAHVIDGLGSGGAEALLVTNLRHFDRERHRHVVVTVFEPGSSRYPSGRFWESAVTELGIDIHPLGCSGRNELAWMPVRLGGYLRAAGVRLMHSHLLYANLVSRMAGIISGVPVISSVHNLSYGPAEAGYKNPGSRKHDLVRYLDGVTARVCCERVVAVGRTVACRAEERLHLPRELIRVIYNPVDLSMFDGVERSVRSALLEELGLAPSTLLLLNVARIMPLKAQADAVRALPVIVERHPNAHLVVIGAKDHPSYLAEVERAIEQAGVRDHVHLIGVRRDVASWLAAADVFVFPSISEGLPVALAEAAAAGCACVATDIPSIREVVTDRESGLVVPGADPPRLARAIVELLDDPVVRARLGSEAKRTSRERFSPRRSTAELMDLYDEVLHRGDVRGKDSS